MRTLIQFSLISMMLIFLTGCASQQATATASYSWNIQITQVEVQPSLSTTEVVTLYTGEKNEVLHENAPSDGNVYLLVNLDLTKIDTGGAPFDWNQLKVEDAAGNAYSRLSNDSFLEQHGYTPRMTGLSIRFGENTGWIAFELPEKAADGKLYLVYDFSEGQQKIEIDK